MQNQLLFDTQMKTALSHKGRHIHSDYTGAQTLDDSENNSTTQGTRQEVKGFSGGLLGTRGGGRCIAGIPNGPIELKPEVISKFSLCSDCARFSCSQNFCNCSHARILVKMCFNYFDRKLDRPGQTRIQDFMPR